MTHNFEPKLIGFMCNWCSYAGADLAGVSRYQYPSNMRILRVMCSARVDPILIVDMFLQGADGVFVGGCHLGDCHYIKGNYYAELRMNLAKKVLARAGLKNGRLRLEWVSASEGERFSKLMKEFTDEIRSLGPSPADGSAPSAELVDNLKAAREILCGFRLRTLVGKEYDLTQKGNVYNEVVQPQDMEKLISEAVDSEFARSRILAVTQETPRSVKEISGIIKMPTDRVLEHIVVLRKKNMLALSSIDDNSPKFKAMVAGVS